jgi:hypothetical protein
VSGLDAAEAVTIKDLWQSQQAQTERLSGAIGSVERVLERLTGHLDAIDQRNARADGILSDLEVRMRLLERWRYALPTSVLLGVGSAAAAVVSLLHG